LGRNYENKQANTGIEVFGHSAVAGLDARAIERWFRAKVLNW
jgi:hypothetical protein